MVVGKITFLGVVGPSANVRWAPLTGRPSLGLDMEVADSSLEGSTYHFYSPINTSPTHLPNKYTLWSLLLEEGIPSGPY